MTKKEIILLFGLINTTLICSSYICWQNTRDSIKSNQKQIIQYKKAISDINIKSKKSPKNQTQILPMYEELTIEEVLSDLLEKFSKNNVNVLQYKLTKTKDAGILDISLKASVFNFGVLLYTFEKEINLYSISSISAKEDNNEISFNLRVTNEPSAIKNGIPLVNNQNRLFSLFKKSEQKQLKNAGPINEQTVKKDVGEYKIVGKSSSAENEINYFLKNTRTGQITIIKKEDVLSETKDLYIVNINNEKQEIKK